MTDEPPMWRLITVAVAGVADAMAANALIGGGPLGVASMLTVLLAAGWALAQLDHTYLRARSRRQEAART